MSMYKGLERMVADLHHWGNTRDRIYGSNISAIAKRLDSELAALKHAESVDLRLKRKDDRELLRELMTQLESHNVISALRAGGYEHAADDLTEAMNKAMRIL